MPHDAPNFAAVVALVVGIILWLLGGRLLRVGACLMGVAISVIISLVFVTPPINATLAATAIVLAAILGLALGWALFRLWMGLSLGLVLALAVPMTVLAFEGIDPPGAGQPPASSPNLPTVMPVAMRDRDLSQLQPMTPEQQSQVDALELATTRLNPAITTTSDWWHSLTPEARLDAQRYALIAGVVGLVFGLVAPTTAAAFQSSILGAFLILASTIVLAPTYAPSLDSLLPHETKSFLVIMLMLAATGFVIQWASGRPKADKEPKAEPA